MENTVEISAPLLNNIRTSDKPERKMIRWVLEKTGLDQGVMCVGSELEEIRVAFLKIARAICESHPLVKGGILTKPIDGKLHHYVVANHDWDDAINSQSLDTIDELTEHSLSFPTFRTIMYLVWDYDGQEIINLFILKGSESAEADAERILIYFA